MKVTKMMLSMALLLPLAGQVHAQEEDGDGPRSCGEKRSECVASCDSERTFFVFKGERYDSCVDQCEARFPDDCDQRGRQGRDGERGNKDDRGGERGERGHGGDRGKGNMEHPQDKDYGYEKNADKDRSGRDEDDDAERDEDARERAEEAAEEARERAEEERERAEEARERAEEAATDDEAGEPPRRGRGKNKDKVDGLA